MSRCWTSATAPNWPAATERAGPHRGSVPNGPTVKGGAVDAAPPTCLWVAAKHPALPTETLRLDPRLNESDP